MEIPPILTLPPKLMEYPKSNFWLVICDSFYIIFSLTLKSENLGSLI
jgi:hypothetical protein